MAFDMNRPLLEREWISPKLRQISELANGLDLDGDLVGYVQQVYGGLVVHVRGTTKTQFYFSEMNPLGYVWLAIKRLYPQHFVENHATAARRFKKERPVIAARLNQIKKSGDGRFGGKLIRTGSLTLEKVDNDWLKATRIYPYLKAERQLMRQLVAHVGNTVLVKARGGKLFN
jgi:hypothetical protein